MSDLIDRQAAIDAVKSYWKNEVDRIPKKSTDFDVITQICDSILTHNANICKAIDKLPSAQPQRKKGKWIEKEYSPFYCSVCGTYQYSASWEIKNKEYNFCPRCGARMDGESDE